MSAFSDADVKAPLYAGFHITLCKETFEPNTRPLPGTGVGDAVGTGVGVAVGTGVGVAVGIGVGVAVGIGVGVAVGTGVSVGTGVGVAVGTGVAVGVGVGTSLRSGTTEKESVLLEKYALIALGIKAMDESNRKAAARQRTCFVLFKRTTLLSSLERSSCWSQSKDSANTDKPIA